MRTIHVSSTMRVGLTAAAIFGLQAADRGQTLSTAPATPEYVITDLGSISGSPYGNVYSLGYGINNSGEVVGWSAVDSGGYHGFRTAANSPINPATDDLGAFGGPSSGAYAINNSGQVTGYAYSRQFGQHAFRTMMGGGPINPATDDLGTVPRLRYSLGVSINDAGQVVGYCWDYDGPPFFRSFRTAPNRPINIATDDLGTLGRPDATTPFSINNLGQVVGVSTTAGGEMHGFRTAPNSPINPATDDLGPVHANAINDVGQVVGAYGNHAFRTAPNAPFNPATDDLGMPTGSNWTGIAATGINNSGQVVGHASTGGLSPQQKAFLYTDGVMYDLNGLIATGSEWELRSASAINDVGQIAGYGVHHGDGNLRAFRLDPITVVAIDIKPGDDPPSINPRSSGNIPVAILSSSSFNAPARVDQSSLTFGRTGDEQSLAFCSGLEDVNQDGLLDLICHFNARSTDFQAGDTQGVLKGSTVNSLPIEGTDPVRITR